MDCRLFGEVTLDIGRLTDLLNVSSELRIVDARLESLVDGHSIHSPELTVAVDELCALVADGPRGDPARRLHTRTINVVVELGPYHVTGAIHGTSASNPLAAVLRRPPWVPLTEATISYRIGLDSVSDEVSTLLVNRSLASSLRAEDEEAERLPWAVPRPAQPVKAEAPDLEGALGEKDRPDHGWSPIGLFTHEWLG